MYNNLKRGNRLQKINKHLTKKIYKEINFLKK